MTRTSPFFHRIARFFALLLFITAPAWATRADDGLPRLTVYTYDSFISEWGPGPAVTEAFEARCNCRLNWVAVDSSLGLMGRLLLEGGASRADVVLGLDAALAAEAAQSGLFTPHGQDTARLALPAPWTDPLFLPFDYGYFAFIYDSRRLTEPPRSLRELVFAPAGGPTVIIQDPRSSTPGLGLLLWIRKVFGAEAPAAWRSLAPRIITATKSWSEAYGMFLNGEGDMVLSYTSSAAYHRIAEGVSHYRAAPFTEGHYMQTEVAAKLKTAAQPELADRFMAFLLSPEFQEAIPTGNWMYPVISLPDGLPAGFQEDSLPAALPPHDAATVARMRRDWTREWLDATAR